jgi:hypothetical protein
MEKLAAGQLARHCRYHTPGAANTAVVVLPDPLPLAICPGEEGIGAKETAEGGIGVVGGGDDGTDEGLVEVGAVLVGFEAGAVVGVVTAGVVDGTSGLALRGLPLGLGPA